MMYVCIKEQGENREPRNDDDATANCESLVRGRG